MSIHARIGADIEYSLMRETEERAAEHASACPRAREIHFVLAERYADQVWSLNERLYELGSEPGEDVSAIITLRLPSEGNHSISSDQFTSRHHLSRGSDEIINVSKIILHSRQ